MIMSTRVSRPKQTEILSRAQMSKPTALTDSDLDEQDLRLTKGWVIRYDVMRALVAMARERNAYVRASEDERIKRAIQGAMA